MRHWLCSRARVNLCGCVSLKDGIGRQFADKPQINRLKRRNPPCDAPLCVVSSFFPWEKRRGSAAQGGFLLLSLFIASFRRGDCKTPSILTASDLDLKIFTLLISVRIILIKTSISSSRIFQMMTSWPKCFRHSTMLIGPTFQSARLRSIFTARIFEIRRHKREVRRKYLKVFKLGKKVG